MAWNSLYERDGERMGERERREADALRIYMTYEMDMRLARFVKRRSTAVAR